MKTWQETWRAEDETYLSNADGPFAECGSHSIARFQLAAQAPAMARLLLEAVAAPGDFDAWLARAHETLILAGVKPR